MARRTSALFLHSCVIYQYTTYVRTYIATVTITNFAFHASLQKAQKGESAWLAAGDAAIEDISEIEDNISLMTEEEDEEEEDRGNRSSS